MKISFLFFSTRGQHLYQHPCSWVRSEPCRRVKYIASWILGRWKKNSWDWLFLRFIEDNNLNLFWEYSVISFKTINLLKNRTTKKMRVSFQVGKRARVCEYKRDTREIAYVWVRDTFVCYLPYRENLKPTSSQLSKVRDLTCDRCSSCICDAAVPQTWKNTLK